MRRRLQNPRAEYQVVRFTLPWGGVLTDRKIRLLKDRKISKMSSGAIPSTYVPARNTVFKSGAFVCGCGARQSL